MVGAVRAISSVTHNGLKGKLREIVVRDLLKPLFPSGYIVGTGQIISAWGQTSGQTDIVICDHRVVPPILIDQANGIFPIEAVVATIEVKSKLSASELQMAHYAAAVVTGFVHAPPVGQLMHLPERKIEHVLSFVLAFDTDLTQGGKTELERYAEKYLNDEPALRAICVVDRGFWVRSDKQWHDYNCNCPQGEIVGLVAALVNTCQHVARTRLHPDVRYYIDKPLHPLPLQNSCRAARGQSAFRLKIEKADVAHDCVVRYLALFGTLQETLVCTNLGHPDHRHASSPAVVVHLKESNRCKDKPYPDKAQ